MSGKLAGYIFLIISIALAVLLLTKTINFILCEAIFAVSMITLGILSKGFKGKVYRVGSRLFHIIMGNKLKDGITLRE